MRRKWGWLSAASLMLLLVVTGVVTLTVHRAVHKQESRLLKERANEVSLVLKEAVDSLSSQLETVGRVMQVTSESPAAFRRASAALVNGSKGSATLVLLRQTGQGYRVALVNGPAYRVGQMLAGSVSATLDRAGVAGAVLPTQIMGTGANRTLGVALGPPIAPTGTVLYLQLTLGPLSPPQDAQSAPFHELDTALYDAPTPVPSQALVASRTDLPLRGRVQTVTVKAGATRWALQVRAIHPLVGSTTANAAWLSLGGGILLSILIATVLEVETRRRRSALALYRTEHQIAEGLQRSLLPILPEIDGLEVAARYLAGSTAQEVGGDWYDAFELEGGHVGIAVGDVLGHDIEAAVLMSRVQTALRAHAIVGEHPADVLDRLNHLVASLNTDRLVTVFYGVLGPAGDDGERQLTFANAGHPPPLLHTAGGGVVELDDAVSLLLGAPELDAGPRSQHSLPVRRGSTLLLYTDGLVEVPGESLTELIGDLKLATAAVAADSGPEEICDRVLESMRPTARGDDVAMLVVRLSEAPGPNPGAEPQPARSGRSKLKG
ncbi:MAG TPA: PP2C family protein-serine/threonine phosphatase [Mycobacteriales bacterium]|nr:PP2C family protein-serine/threonine phosphatase [Mycobacteriales bacterium]